MSPACTLARRSPMWSLITIVVVLTACEKDAPADAYGNFEAEEVVVSAETAGQLQAFEPREGMTLGSQVAIAVVDTLQLGFERNQLAAQRASLVAHRAEAVEQQRTLEAQHDIARRTRQRIDRLFAEHAATAQQRDQTERDERSLAGQVNASRAGITRINADIAALDARLAAVADRMRRATISNPVAGTVLATYVRAGEVIQPGQPLYRIASLDTLTLRAYVTGAQLAGLSLGRAVTVHVDGGRDTLRAFRGTVSWIASRAEFTPTPVQTREARGDLVYAIKVRVANPDGALKIGMPGDATWTADSVRAP